MKKSLPAIGITMGDPAGIGPEVVLKALKLPQVLGSANLVVFGSARVLKERSQRFKIHPGCPFKQTVAPGEPGRGLAGLSLVDFGYPTPGKLPLGQVTGECGQASASYIEEATAWALAGSIDAIVTAPINKQSLALAGVPFAGHTELLASRTGVETVVMMLVTESLKVALVTRHMALREVPDRLTTEGIRQTIVLTVEGLRRYFGFSSPRVGVCALNPHASDGGRFGNEEEVKIAPAISQSKGAGINCIGPLPADTAFQRGRRGEFDVVIAMYHDQGLIPIKTLGFGQAVNVTLGLPIIRTSVDHGTGFDIVESGTASCDSLVAAINLACQMHQQAGKR